MKKTLIVVLGMHRSGTSAMAGLLSKLGINLGENLISGADDNAKGHFEHRDVVGIDESILEMVGSREEDFLPIASDTEEADDSLQSSIHSFLNQLTADADISAIKDPRLCRTLPAWKTVFSELDLQIKYLLIVRHPLEVAASLTKRNGYSVNKGLMLWMAYVLDSFHNTQDENRMVITFTELLDKSDKATSEVAKFCGVKVMDTGDFLEKSLKHNIHKKLKLNADPEIEKSALEVFKQIKSKREKVNLSKATKKYTELAAQHLGWDDKSGITLWKKLQEVQDWARELDARVSKQNEQLKKHNKNILRRVLRK